MTPSIDDDADHWLDWPAAAADTDTDTDTDTAALRLRLMPERALFEPATRTLFVADVHIGKAAVFRARGLPVPRGTTTGTLARLSQALQRSGAQRLVVLGDFLHARESHAPATMAALAAWRARHAALECTVVEGNHDRHAGQVHTSLGIRLLRGVHSQAGLRGVHEPDDAPDGAASPVLTLAGHVHPVVRLSTRIDSLRLPCFWLRGAVLTLPAFGEFTGGFLIERGRLQAAAAPAERFFVVSEAVLPLG